MPPDKSGRPAGAVRTPRADTDSASWAGSPDVRWRMQWQQTRDTAPELRLRRAPHAAGLRCRVHAAPVPSGRRRADVLFRQAKVRVLVDRRFWHGCPEHGGRTPTTSAFYWADKLRRNQARDADTDRRFHEAGWLSLRLWEHQDLAEAAREVADAVRLRRQSSQ